jgi:hypothetical protein
LDECRDALKIVEELRKRALKVVDRAPYWRFVDNEDWAKIAILDDGNVELSWFEETVKYDSATLRKYEVVFPSVLLLMPGAALDNWKAEQMVQWDLRMAERLAEQEALERVQLAALKAKYKSEA